MQSASRATRIDNADTAQLHTQHSSAVIRYRYRFALISLASPPGASHGASPTTPRPCARPSRGTRAACAQPRPPSGTASCLRHLSLAATAALAAVLPRRGRHARTRRRPAAAARGRTVGVEGGGQPQRVSSPASCHCGTRPPQPSPPGGGAVEGGANTPMRSPQCAIVLTGVAPLSGGDADASVNLGRSLRRRSGGADLLEARQQLLPRGLDFV